jgi:hypothetical protein
MKIAPFFLWTLLLVCGNASAQTNCPVCPLQNLYVPALRLMPQQPASTPAPAVAHATIQSVIEERIADTNFIPSGISDYDLYGPPGRARQFVLVRAEPPPESGFVRAVDAIFSPEVVHLGKTTELSCSVLTAIKRKNPLCLLNPLVFQLSW